MHSGRKIIRKRRVKWFSPRRVGGDLAVVKSLLGKIGPAMKKNFGLLKGVFKRSPKEKRGKKGGFLPRCEQLAFGLQLFALIFGILLFGAVHTWVYSLVFLCILAASLLLIPGRFLRREYPDLGTPGADARADAGEEHDVRVRAGAGEDRDEAGDHRDLPLPAPDAPAGRRGDGHRAVRRDSHAYRDEEGARHDRHDGAGAPARPGASGRLVFVWPLGGMTPLFVSMTLLLIFQMTPLPDFLVSVLSPEAKVAGLASLPAPQVVASPWPGDVWYSVAPYAYPVRMSLIRWTAYGLFFFGLLQTLRTRRRIETAVLAILFTAAFDSLYGIMETYSRHHHVWWYLHATEKSVHGTYINRNHFAGLMEMGMIMAAAYAGAYAADLARRRSSRRRPDLRERILTFFSGDGIFTRRFLIIFMGAVMGVGLILSASRGGIMAGAGGLFILGTLLFLRREQRRKGKIILAIFLIVAFYSLPAGIDYVLDRFMVIDQGYEGRMLASQKTLDIYKDYRRSGVGVGNFPYAFPKYQDERQKMTSYEHGHNDWAQFLAEAGVAGMVVAAAAGTWFVFVYLRRWRRRRSTFAVCLGAGGIASLAAILIHSIADFNLHLPANFLLLAATLAIGTAALHLDRLSTHQDVLLLPGTSLPLRGAGAVPLALLLGLILWNGQWVIRHYLAEIYCPTVPNMTLNLDWRPPPADIARAMSFDGGNAEYAFRMAMELTEIRNKEATRNGSATPAWAASHGPIIAALERSVRLNPFNAEAHKCLGWEYTYLNSDPDYGRIWLPAADLSMERATYMGGDWVMNPWLHIDLGNYWVMRSKAYGFDPPKQEDYWFRAMRHYHKALTLTGNKKILKDITGFIRGFYPEKAAPGAPPLF